METRHSNKTKHFYEFQVVSDDEEPQEPGNDSGEDIYDDSDLEDADGHGGIGSEVTSDEEPASGGRTNARERPTRSLRKKHRSSAADKDFEKLHGIKPYSIDSRALTRNYVGPLRRYARFAKLFRVLYGPERARLELVTRLNERWRRYPVLPAKFLPEARDGVLLSPWLPAGFEEDEKRRCSEWYDKFQAAAPKLQKSHIVAAEHGKQFLPSAERPLIALLGPHDRQKQYELSQGDSVPLSPSGLSVEDPDVTDKTPSGWLFDVGGLVLAMAWLPQSGVEEQVLAVAASPHSDQAYNAGEEKDGEEKNVPLEENKSIGSIQFWKFSSAEDDSGTRRPSTKLPQLVGAVCFNWGRPKRLQWCPIALGASGAYGILAVLCGDGQARILEIDTFDENEPSAYRWIELPIATLGFTTDYNVRATCLTWVSTNRIVLGHSDGTLTLWSIYPRRLLLRHAVHTSFVLDVSSGYPSHPYLIASAPVGGTTSLTDLNNPSAESTYIPTPVIAFQPNLLAWSDHLQCYLGTWPSSSSVPTMLATLHHRFFSTPKRLLSVASQPTCLAVGATHPFLLVGCADGSLWACNALAKVLRRREDAPWKIKVLEHEFRPVGDSGASQLPASGSAGADDDSAPALGPVPAAPLSARSVRGAVRVLQGFLPEQNINPRTETEFLQGDAQREGQKSKGRKGKRAQKAPREEEPSDDSEVADDDDPMSDSGQEEGQERAGVIRQLTSRLVIHEPLTRVTCVTWNPNVEFGWWGAAAMGSGLIRIMDLGVEY